MLPRLLGTRAAGFTVAAVLAAALAAKAVFAFPFQLGIDFYQFWGVPVAHRSIAASPYLDPPAYERALNGIADASDNAKLKHANGFRRSLETMATPFFYSTFALAPGDFETAQILFTLLLYASTAIGVFLLARTRGAAPWPAVWLALFVELTFNPFLQDVRVSNVNSLQFLYVAAMVYVAASGRHPRSAALESLYVGSLAFFVLFKPNTPWIALALAAHYGGARGWRKLASGLGAACVCAILALGLGAWFFHDANVWMEWFRFTQGMNGGSLVRTVEQGNLAPAMLLFQRSGTFGLLTYALLITACLAFAVVLAMTGMGRRSRELLPAARRTFSDPGLAASLGVMFTLATSPLVWPFYHLFALVPMILFFRPRQAPMRAACIAVSYLAMTGPLLELLGRAGFGPVIPLLMLWAWAPLLVAVLGEVADRALATPMGDGQNASGP